MPEEIKTKRKKTTKTKDISEETTSAKTKKVRRSNQSISNLKKSPVRVFALGGLGEVGKNMYVIEDANNIFVIDVGVMFPDEMTPGVDYIAPDMSYLIENQEKIRGVFITHGHEDHIGSIPFMLKLMKVPAIYAPKLAMQLIRKKLDEFGLRNACPLIEYKEDTVVRSGEFTIQFFRVTHSIPDSFGICFDTPQGRIVTTGDFKIDLTPVDHDFNFSKLTKLADEGIDLLMADSTNAEKSGYTTSESDVINAILKAFSEAPGRIIITTFSSNLSRITQIIQASLRYNRKICIVGRSMETNIIAAREMGYLKLPDKCIIPIDQINNYKKNEIVVICTGSQGEQQAALSRMASGSHRQINAIPGDTVIFSSSPIPGNGYNVNLLINKLLKNEVNVLTNSPKNVLHASGHPSVIELKLMQKLTHPQYFMPIHGDYRMLKIHAEIAQRCGLPKENTFILSNGDTVQLLNHVVTQTGERVHARALLVEGRNPINTPTKILNERRQLEQEGAIAILLFLDTKNNTFAMAPIVNSVGFSEIRKTTIHKSLIFNTIKITYNFFNTLRTQNYYSDGTLERLRDYVQDEISRYIEYSYKRTPKVIVTICKQ